jgi:hypothetical protein
MSDADGDWSRLSSRLATLAAVGWWLPGETRVKSHMPALPQSRDGEMELILYRLPTRDSDPSHDREGVDSLKRTTSY